jgi:hypothetical protein
MSSTWPEALEAEDIDMYGGEGESYLDDVGGDGEAFDEADDSAEARVSRSRRTARARRLAQARHRAALARARSQRAAQGRPTTAAVVRRTEAEVANLEVETKVQADAVNSALAAQAKRIRAGETATAASTVVAPLLSFLQNAAPQVGNNDFTKKGLPLAPLLLLKPAKRGQGVQGLLSDPRVWAIGATAGLALADGFSRRGGDVARIQIIDVPVSTANPVRFSADAFDANNRPITRSVRWVSANPSIADVNPVTGVVTGITQGSVDIIAIAADGTSDRVAVTVT